MTIEADSAAPRAIRAAVTRVVKRLEPTDTVVVNASLMRVGTIDTFSVENLDLILAVNARGAFLVIQATAAYIRYDGTGHHD